MRLCVYTVLIGRYDALIEQPFAAESSADFICLTDDPDLTSDSWEIRRVEPRFGQDPVRSARLLKILGEDSLDQYEVSLYIDASVRLRRLPEHIVEEWLPHGIDIALARHGYRDQLVDEFDEVVRLQYDEPSRVYEQLNDYSFGDPGVLEAQPLWTGILVRRRTAAVAAAMRVWADHVLRYSRRDQLSVIAALRSSQATVKVLDVPNFESAYHEWPVIPQRRITQGKSSGAMSPGPLLVELRRVRRRLEEVNSELGGRPAHDVVAAEQYERSRADDAQQRLESVTRELAATTARLQRTTGVKGACRNLAAAIAGRIRPRV